MTKEQIEQKLQRLTQLSEESDAILKELAEAGALELSDEELKAVTGSRRYGSREREALTEISEKVLKFLGKK